MNSGTTSPTASNAVRSLTPRGPAALKRSGKFGLIARIEGTVTNVSFLAHCRTGKRWEGTTEIKRIPLRKSIYSLLVLRGLLGTATQCSLDFLAAI